MPGDLTAAPAAGTPFSSKSRTDKQFDAPTIEQARDMLSYIPADCDRTQWIKIGGALRHEFGDAAGFDLFDEWSQRSADQYDARDTLSAWRSLKGGAANPATFKTIAGIARDAGWVPSSQARKLTPAESEQRARDRAERDAKSEAEAVARRKVAAERADGVLKDARPYTVADAAQNDYLQRHGLDEGYGAMIGTFSTNDQVVSEHALLIPIMDMGKKVHSVQVILPDANNPLKRDKTYLAGGDKRGHFFRIGQPKMHDGKHVVLVAEGFATAASLHKATGHCVFVAFDAGNLKPVAEAIRTKVQTATILLCADNDRFTAGNPGRTRARQAAAAVSGLVALPEFDGAPIDGDKKGPTDFNDLAMMRGTHDDAAIHAVIEAALEANVVITQADVDAEWVRGKIAEMTTSAVEHDALAGVVAEEEEELVDVAADGAIGSDEDDKPSTDFVGDVLDDTAPGENPFHNNRYFRVLGVDVDTYYFFKKGKRNQIIGIKTGGLTQNALMSLAPINWWEIEALKTEKGKFHKDSAVGFLMDAAESVGLYDPTLMRGRGAWWDEGRLVVHLGDRLLIDGKESGLGAIDSEFMYQGGRRIGAPAAVALSSTEGRLLLDTAKSFSWERNVSGPMLCGWLLLSPLCGALRWRPHAWVTGSAGSGKTTILDEFVRPLIPSRMELFANGDSTEAGLRQELRSDARPILIDESESDGEAAKLKMQKILVMLRQSSSDTGSQTYRGTVSGSALSFQVRSMALLSSIGVALERQQDMERVTVLALKPKRKGTDTNLKNWPAIRAALNKIRSDETINARLFRRSISLAPVIMKSIDVFTEAAATVLGTAREGDQIGALLAGAWCMVNDHVPTLDEALAEIGQYEWGNHQDGKAEEQEDLVATLMSRPVTRQGGLRTLIGKLIARAAGHAVEGPEIDPDEANNELHNFGMKVAGDCLLMHTKNDELKKLMRETDFAAGLRGRLARIDGVRSVSGMRIGEANTSGLSIPLSALLVHRDPNREEF